MRGSHTFVYSIGAEVEVDWGLSGWHPAVIVKQRLNGADIEEYDVEYSDHSKVGLTGWKGSKIRLAPAPPQAEVLPEQPLDAMEQEPTAPVEEPPAGTSSSLLDNIKRRPRVQQTFEYAPGTHVEVFWTGMNEWYPAIIESSTLAASGKAVYDVSYEDGSTTGTRAQKEANIRLPQNPPPAPPSAKHVTISEGMKQAHPEPKTATKKAELKASTYETPAPDHASRASKRHAESFCVGPLEFSVGQRVGVHWGGGDYYAATITNAWHDGHKQLYDVEYDDPDGSMMLTRAVTLSKIRRIDEVRLTKVVTPVEDHRAPAQDDPPKHKMNEETQKKRKREEPKVEQHVAVPQDKMDMNRLIKRRQTSSADHVFNFRQGQEVEVNWGKNTWYLATIARAYLEGSIEYYDVEYADGSPDNTSGLKNGVLRNPKNTKLSLTAYLEQESTGDRFPLKLGVNRVGRGDSQDIVVPTSFASSHHATLSFTQDGKCSVTDSGSTNKSWIRSPNESRHIELEPNVPYDINENFRFRVADINYRLRFDHVANM